MGRQTNFVKFSADPKLIYVDMNRVSCIAEHEDFLKIHMDDHGCTTIKVDLENLETIQRLMTEGKI